MTKIKSLREIVMERAHECSEIVGNRFLPSVRIIYGVNRRGFPEAIGTCFLLAVGGVPFLVTAAHVIDQSAASLHFGYQGRLLPVEGMFQITNPSNGARENDHFDFAFAKVGADVLLEMESRDFISADEVSRNRGTFDGRQFLLLGYPASRNKSVVVGKKTVPSRAWTFQGSNFENPQLAAALGVSGHTHIFLKYEKRVGRYDGSIENAIGPRGVSGGVLIDLALPGPDQLASDANCTGRLCGLFIEYHEDFKALVCVKIEVILEKIREHLRSNQSN